MRQQAEESPGHAAHLQKKGCRPEPPQKSISQEGPCKVGGYFCHPSGQLSLSFPLHCQGGFLTPPLRFHDTSTEDGTSGATCFGSALTATPTEGCRDGLAGVLGGTNAPAPVPRITPELLLAPDPWWSTESVRGHQEMLRFLL